MRHWDTVAIVGVGLIGGSIGLALRQRGLAEQVVGIGRRVESLEMAEGAGAVTQTTCDLADGVADADFVVVCTPVDSIVSHVQQVAAARGEAALITDAGSTKAAIVEQLDATLPPDVRFVGSHPLAGSEKTGPQHARADLLDGRVVVVTQTQATHQEDCDAVAEFWMSLGARVSFDTPANHDRALALTSHLPHVVASLLVACLQPEDFDRAASGFCDTTRIAAADPELWAQILLHNRRPVLEAMGSFHGAMSVLRGSLEQEDKDRLVQLLAEAKRKRDDLGD